MKKTMKTMIAAAMIALTTPALADSGAAPLQDREAWRAPGVTCFNNISDPRIRGRRRVPALERAHAGERGHPHPHPHGQDHGAGGHWLLHGPLARHGAALITCWGGNSPSATAMAGMEQGDSRWDST